MPTPADNNVDVDRVVIEGRLMPWNYTFSTNTSRWLNINGINRFYTDFDAVRPLQVEVYLMGYINEPCPAQAKYDAPGLYCQYVFHGVQSQVGHPALAASPPPSFCSSAVPTPHHSACVCLVSLRCWR